MVDQLYTQLRRTSWAIEYYEYGDIKSNMLKGTFQVSTRWDLFFYPKNKIQLKTMVKYYYFLNDINSFPLQLCNVHAFIKNISSLIFRQKNLYLPRMYVHIFTLKPPSICLPSLTHFAIYALDGVFLFLNRYL